MTQNENSNQNKTMTTTDVSAVLNKLTPLGIIAMIVWQLMQGFNVLMVDAKQYMNDQTKFNYQMLSVLNQIKDKLEDK